MDNLKPISTGAPPRYPTPPSYPRPRTAPQSLLIGALRSPLFFATLTATLCVLFSWPKNWLISGAPIFHFLLLLGNSKGKRVLESIHLWPILTTLHLGYAICSTSWLLYWVFVSACYPALFLISLFQFNAVGQWVRTAVRKVVLLNMVHFVEDKIALFDLPALEIDTEVDGLMVLRGVTLSLSTLSLVVHGVEVGIKLSADMELAIQTESVTVRLFRGVEIGDVFANLKGGEYEMTFGGLESSAEDERDGDGDAVLVQGTALLKAASRSSTSIETAKMKEVMTAGSPPMSTTPKAGFESVTTLSPDADSRYLSTLEFLGETNSIATARSSIRAQALFSETEDRNALRAAICSQLHSEPSVPHPPENSIRVTTIKALSSPRQKAFMHRLPMLLRLLLNPLSYFHPVSISSITASASGRWVDATLSSSLFKHYAAGNSEIAALQERIGKWLCDAHFAVELVGIKGVARVPFLTDYDIVCDLSVSDVMAYRSLAPGEAEPEPEQGLSRASTTSSIISKVFPPQSLEKGEKEAGEDQKGNLKQIIRLGGADARFTIPAYLLPYHEHILPPPPPPSDNLSSAPKLQELEKDVDEADGKPKTLQAERELEKMEKDECGVGMSVHVRLPAVFDQTLLDFAAAVGKASKIVELEQRLSSDSDPDTPPEEDEDDDKDEEGKSKFRVLKEKFKGGVKRKATSALFNDRWIAKMVGKITRKLEVARGEAGYSGEIPVPLGKYRTGLMEVEGEKLLP